MPHSNTTLLHIAQRTTRPILETTLTDSDGAPIDLSDAEQVTISTEHHELGFTGAASQPVEITDAEAGEVQYQFAVEEISLDGKYQAQFAIEYPDDTTQLVPSGSDRHYWVIVGRRLPRGNISPVFQQATVETLVADRVEADALAGGLSPTGAPITRLDGPDLEITDNGELGWVDPGTGGYTAGSDHNHSATGEGGDTLLPLQVGSTSSRVGEGHFDTLTATEPTTPESVVRAADVDSHEPPTDAEIQSVVDGADIDIAGNAASATRADSADTADDADYATQAGSANSAQSAETAANADNANNLGGNPPSYYTTGSGGDAELSGYVQSPDTARIWTRTDDPTLSATDVHNNDIWLEPDTDNNQILGHVRVNGAWIDLAGGSTDDGSDGGSGGDEEPTGTWVDTFERGNLSPYVVSGAASATANAAHSGSYGGAVGPGGAIRSMDGLSNYPQQGDSFDVWIKTSETGGTNLYRIEWGLQNGTNSDNCYRLQMELSTMNFYVRSDGASENYLTYTDVSFPTGTWRRVHVDWGSDGVFTIGVYTTNGALLEEQTTPSSDTTFSGGGVGAWTNASTGVHVDDWEIV